MILMRENPFRGPLEGVGPENQDFFCGPVATREASAIWDQKNRGPTPSNGPSNVVSRIKIIKSKRHIKKQVHW